ncbi:helix-turn-helix domain-containing protein [Micromonospora sp. CPCC 206061]|uniref:helix-turn-helix domain-containing protein n=1 Tax=Micromonospora sp. CPCC 206061 TaxID=3122410 RepID=UPI002FEF8780
MWLGERLRQLREERGLTLRLVAEHLNRDPSALARYEKAEWPIPRADVVNLLELYGIHDSAQRDRSLRLAENVWPTHRWSPEPDDDADASFIDLPWLAARAERLCLSDPGMVPEPVQTPRYNELVARFAQPGSKDARSSEQRRNLQRALAAADIKIEAVVDEWALHRTVGGVETLRAQLVNLRDLQQGDRAVIRVLPSEVAIHPGLSGRFWLFEMPHPYPPVGYEDGLGGQHYVEAPQADRFADAYHQLADAALEQNESAELIEERIKALA